MEKMKSGIFDGPQIRKLIQDQAFTSHMTAVESAAWCSYVSEVREFLGHSKASNYRFLWMWCSETFKLLVQGWASNFVIYLAI